MRGRPPRRAQRVRRSRTLDMNYRAARRAVQAVIRIRDDTYSRSSRNVLGADFTRQPSPRGNVLCANNATGATVDPSGCSPTSPRQTRYVEWHKRVFFIFSRPVVYSLPGHHVSQKQQFPTNHFLDSLSKGRGRACILFAFAFSCHFSLTIYK